MNLSTRQIQTSDGLSLRLLSYLRSDVVAHHERPPLLVVPGFAQHAATKTFAELCSGLPRVTHCLDLRGTGLSEGRFTFGAAEYLDILAAIDTIAGDETKIDILGFSLGAYSTLRAAATRADKIDSVYLVSCPTSVDEIVRSGSVFKHAWATLREPSMLNKERSLRFRWDFPFRSKPSACQFAAGLDSEVKAHFLAGQDDLLTPPAMSHQVFNSTPNASWCEFAQGLHAEQMYFQDPARFIRWLESPPKSSGASL